MKKHYPSISKCAVKSLLAVSVSFAVQASAQDGKVLEEIVVTAEHRTSTLQDTQISITAMSSQNIEDLGISNSVDLGHVAPNMVVNNFQGGKSGVGISMRGMAQNETLVAYDPAVGVYIDDVLISKNVGAVLDVVDMERIEILRGPQGTLYGRNTMGGTVNFITRKPTDELEGKIVATVGKYGQRDLKGVLNLPLLGTDSGIGALNMRVSAATINRDGLTDNNYSGPSPYAPPLAYDTTVYGTGGNDDPRLRETSDELETKDRKALLLHLQWEPSDDLQVLYSYDRTRIDEVPGAPWTTNTNPADPPRPAGTAVLGPFAIGTGTDRPSSISVNGPQVAETEVDGHSLTVDYSLADTLTVKSITSVREMENFSTADSDGSPLPIIQTIDTNINDQFTQEFRLIGTAMDARLDFTIGLFYMDEDGKVDQRLDALGFPGRTVAEFTNKNWALYGQATYALTDKWSITAGVRYTEEDREMSKVWYPSFLDKFQRGLPFTLTSIDFGTAQGDFDNISPMVSLGYDWNDDLMTYFKISTGFQSGGFNVRDSNVIESPSGSGNFLPATFHDGFEEETLLAYEFGLKASIADRVRVNTALWYSDYDDKRVNNFDPDTLGNTVRNAGVVEIYGLELEVFAQLSENFQLGFNYGYQKPEYKEYDSPNPNFDPSCTSNCEPEIIDLSGSTTFPYTPENSVGINLVYEQQLNVGLLRARIDWAYKDDYTFLAPTPERNSQQAYDIWNARVTLDDIAGPGDTVLRASLWGKNLTDESYYYNGVNIFDTFGFDINLYAEPRTYGMDVELRF